jgi:hypothetical protein
MLEAACQLHYNDAQDMLMFGIYQYPPAELLPVLRRILTHWNREGNIDICSSGTGEFSETLQETSNSNV